MTSKLTALTPKQVAERLSRGDAVLVELPTFTGAIAAFRSVGAHLAGVRQDLADEQARLGDVQTRLRDERAQTNDFRQG